MLLDHELLAANAETWFLARAFRLARRELSAAGIVAYCDPLPRLDDRGAVVKRGHTGTISIRPTTAAMPAGRPRER